MLSRHMELFERTVGVDEAGRGALAGPVVVAGVILPRDFETKIGDDLKWVRDSKKLSSARIHYMYERLTDICEVATSAQDSKMIDTLNIYWATMHGMEDVCEQLKPNLALIDGGSGPRGLKIPWHPIPKGDSKVLCIAAASIVAKFTRDNIMLGYNEIYPGWGFDGHKGYGAKSHMERLRQGEYLPIHRRSFNPLRLLHHGH